MNTIPTKLYKFLKKHKAYFQIQVHPETFTSCETAESEHIRGRKLLKAVMAKANEKDIMVVIPSNRTVDLLKLSAVLDTPHVRIAEEWEFKDQFPECEPGAMPPFGHIYGIPCYGDESIREEDEVVFNAGNHKETMSISTNDFFRISKALSGDYSVLGKKLAV